jgi:hypothetical protein
MIGEDVRGPQQHGHELRGKLDLLAARHVEQRLEDVREPDQGLQAEGSRPALDGVHRPEDGVDRFSVLIARFELEEAGLQVRQEFVALLEEGLADFLELVHGIRPRPS